MESTSMAAVSSLTTRSGKPRALTGAAIRMLGHDVDDEPTRIGDSLRTVSERRRSRRRGYFLSGRRGPPPPHPYPLPPLHTPPARSPRPAQSLPADLPIYA